MSERLVLFGLEDNFNLEPAFNLILLLAKTFIYACKFNEDKPQMETFKKKVMWRYKIEKYKALIQQRVFNFNLIWYKYISLVES